MPDTIGWLLTLTVREGKRPELEGLIADMIASTRQEPGTLEYDWSVSEDDAVVYLSERYRDSAAALIHLETFAARFAPRFTATLKPTAMLVQGTPNQALRAALTPMRAVFTQALGGLDQPG